MAEDRERVGSTGKCDVQATGICKHWGVNHNQDRTESGTLGSLRGNRRNEAIRGGTIRGATENIPAAESVVTEHTTKSNDHVEGSRDGLVILKAETALTHGRVSRRRRERGAGKPAGRANAVGTGVHGSLKGRGEHGLT